MKLARAGSIIALTVCVLLELALRIPFPALKQLNGEVTRLPYKILYTAALPYEPAPHSPICENEFVNQDALRGPDVPLKKGPNVIRIMTFGDSMVQGCSTTVEESWQKELERAFAHEPAAKKGMRLETINLGVGGYHAREALVRLKQRGLKYEFDLAILHADWNDLFFSSLPEWKPGFSLVDVKSAHAPAVDQTPGWKSALYKYSALAKTGRSLRNKMWNKSNAIASVQDRLVASKLPFNEQALQSYLDALDKIHKEVTKYGTKLVLVRSPMYFHTNQKLTDQVLYHNRIVLQNFPLSPGEQLDWQDRYTEAQRAFAKAHPDVIFIEATKSFDSVTDAAERESLFTDHVHFTAKGSALFAREIYAGIQAELNRLAQR